MSHKIFLLNSYLLVFMNVTKKITFFSLKPDLGNIWIITWNDLHNFNLLRKRTVTISSFFLPSTPTLTYKWLGEWLSGSGPNGAIIHYKPEPDNCRVVDPKKLFLLDSGAQYVDGTTDITRTVHFGEPTAREKECFTRVLQVLDTSPIVFHLL